MRVLIGYTKSSQVLAPQNHKSGTGMQKSRATLVCGNKHAWLYQGTKLMAVELLSEYALFFCIQ